MDRDEYDPIFSNTPYPLRALVPMWIRPYTTVMTLKSIDAEMGAQITYQIESGKQINECKSTRSQKRWHVHPRNGCLDRTFVFASVKLVCRIRCCFVVTLCNESCFVYPGADDRFTIDPVTGELKTHGRAPYQCTQDEPFKVRNILLFFILLNFKLINCQDKFFYFKTQT